MLDASGILPFELIHVDNDTGAHWETYVIPGNSEEIILNRPQPEQFTRGSCITIMAMSEIVASEIADFVQKVVYVNNNRVLKIENKLMKDYI